MKTQIFKLSKSGKTMLVGHKANKYQVGYIFGWASNADDCKVGDVLTDFRPVGREPVIGDDGPVVHADGSPVMRFVF